MHFSHGRRFLGDKKREDSCASSYFRVFGVVVLVYLCLLLDLELIASGLKWSGAAPSGQGNYLWPRNSYAGSSNTPQPPITGELNLAITIKAVVNARPTATAGAVGGAAHQGATDRVLR
ncbi:unnamed protein product [Amoebophrya sp. A25]|nr:unnamed protein product [Amoebophrya sp. A25]|eukprot:GSA25T00013787001.1